MKQILTQIRLALVTTLILASVCSGIYPLFVWAIAQTIFPDKANGSLLIAAKGEALGSRLIGQGFNSAKYFHPRPSAAGYGYDAANSGGSNLGPTSKKLCELLKERVVAYRQENGLSNDIAIPADAATSSGSGLDPHISPRNAELQVARVAQARGLDKMRLRELIKHHTSDRDLKLFGEPGVNTLTLNLALDSLYPPLEPAQP